MAGGRGSALATASSLLARAKSLDLQRKALHEQIQSCKNTIESRKNEAALINLVLARGELPSLAETSQRLSQLRAAIEAEKEQQAQFKAQSTDLQGLIDSSISMRERKTQYEKAALELKALCMRLDEERQRGKTLKLRQSQLSSQMLKAQLKQKKLKQHLTADFEPPIDIAPIKRKGRSLGDQTRLVRAKREAFEQELTESAEQLHRLRIRRDELTDIAERARSLDPAELQRQILEGAAENTDLRKYKPLPSATNRVLDELTRLSQGCERLLERSQAVLK
jgi:myosin heavy subunit